MQSCLFVNQLTVMDVALLDAERGLLGQSWIVDLELEGPLDMTGMVWDFGEVKRHLKHQIDAVADHVLLVPAASAHLRIEHDNAHALHLVWTLADGRRITHHSPQEAVLRVDAHHITSEIMAAWVSSMLTDLLRTQFNLGSLTARVHLREETIDGASYQYCHGLKKHAGNCQRIAHGHRSALRVWVDGTLCPRTAQQLADAWRDIYLGSREDLQDSFEENGVAYHRFAHVSAQGSFSLTLPVKCVNILDHDTTVEWLATALASRAALLHPEGSELRVQAFEGVQKGAYGHAIR